MCKEHGIEGARRGIGAGIHGHLEQAEQYQSQLHPSSGYGKDVVTGGALLQGHLAEVFTIIQTHIGQAPESQQARRGAAKIVPRRLGVLKKPGLQFAAVACSRWELTLKPSL